MRRQRRAARSRVPSLHRHGGATLDYVLVLAVVLPIVAYVVSRGIRIIQLAYEMICVLIAWPFL